MNRIAVDQESVSSKHFILRIWDQSHHMRSMGIRIERWAYSVLPLGNRPYVVDMLHLRIILPHTMAAIPSSQGIAVVA